MDGWVTDYMVQILSSSFTLALTLAGEIWMFVSTCYSYLQVSEKHVMGILIKQNMF